MPRTIETVPIRPDVLKWARETVGLSVTDAAQALKVSPEVILSWETTGVGVGITQLRKIASVYKRPVLALLQTEAPPLPQLPRDFRTLQSSQPNFSPETMVAIRDAQRIQTIATELLEEDPTLYPPAFLPHAELGRDSAVEFGVLERSHFDVPVSEQLKWPSVDFAFGFWRTKLQRLGILTLVKAMPREDCRGFSLSGSSATPVIVVNGNEAPHAKIFTLFHEYSHLALGENGVCLESAQLRIERWCNDASSSFLMPPDDVRLAINGDPVVSPALVQQLSRQFKVSRHVVAIRLVELHLASQDLYERILEQDRQTQDWEKTTRDRNPNKEFGGIPQEVTRLSEVGSGFASLILNAMEKDLISPVDAADHLDLRPGKFTSLSQRIESSLKRYR